MSRPCAPAAAKPAIWLLIIMLTLLAPSKPAVSRDTLSYDKSGIQAIVLNVHDCSHKLAASKIPANKRCPHYWVLWRPGKSTIYSEYHKNPGTFEIDFDFSRALGMIRDQSFFDLEPQVIDATEINYASISVERRARVVTVFQPLLSTADSRFLALFREIDTAVKGSKKRRLTKKPSGLTVFDYFMSSGEYEISRPLTHVLKREN